ncbi:MAG: thioredoxin family protein [Proteobacteria bacterium]|nr:thioredoxin family protein [Pseudomonadota bacterium]
MSRPGFALLALLLLLPTAGAWAADPLGGEARRVNKPLIVDFGMTRCLQCLQQAKTMERLRQTLGDRVLVRFVHIGKEEEVAAAYKVLLIPTLAFFDAQGREVFRNVGQMEHDEMVAKARELGLIE